MKRHFERGAQRGRILQYSTYFPLEGTVVGRGCKRTREKKRIEEQTSRNFESIDVENTLEALYNI
jgi:hypothetical protein